MEMCSTIQFLQNKTILVTGATGFLAKIMVEKILRIQPNVRKLFLLLRAADTNSATQRLNNDILGKKLFKVLKAKCGEDGFNSLISEKVTVVPGDISCENLGVEDSSLRGKMWKEVDIVINLAATTNFDERYDVALGINTLGVKHVMCFAKKCAKIMLLVHVSTAYVCGEKEGLILEKPFYMGETLNGTSHLDIDVELKLVEKTLKELYAEGAASNKEITSAMKDLGIERARKHGWPNTYVFTKAMGEMIVGHMKEEMPTIILRPTIVTSTYKDPFPGWIEGLRTIDSIAVGIGKGKLTFLLYDPQSIIDAIPADMVVNSMLLAMKTHADKPACEIIYHLGSSLQNPLTYDEVHDFIFRYFAKKPLTDKDGKPIIIGKAKVMTNMDSFHRYIAIRYLLLLKVLELANAAFCQAFRDKYTYLNRKIRFVMRLFELYQPYIFFKGIFDDINMEKLRIDACDVVEDLNLNPKCLDWNDYFMNIHFPGLVKHVLK